MSDAIWRPSVVVAAIAEDAGRFLLVEEETDDGLRLNQPAGHWEFGETLIEAVAREALEETAYRFEPAALLGVYRWSKPAGDVTYLRFAFIGVATHHDPTRTLDTGICRALWLTRDELAACRERHRSPLVLRCVDDYLAGLRFPLRLLHSL